MVTIIFSYYGGLNQVHKERTLGALFSEIYNNNKLNNYIIYDDCDPYSGILTLSIRPIHNASQIKKVFEDLKINYQNYKCNIIILGNGQRNINPLSKLFSELWCV